MGLGGLAHARRVRPGLARLLALPRQPERLERPEQPWQLLFSCTQLPTETRRFVVAEDMRMGLSRLRLRAIRRHLFAGAAGGAGAALSAKLSDFDLVRLLLAPLLVDARSMPSLTRADEED